MIDPTSANRSPADVAIAQRSVREPSISVGSSRSRGIRIPRGSERARLDLRARYPLRWLLPAAILLGGYLGGALPAVIGGTTYVASVRLAGIKLDDGSSVPAIQINDHRLQSLLSLTQSPAFYAEVKLRSGTAASLDELEGVIKARRPAIGGFLFLEARSHDEALVHEVGPQLAPSLAALVDKVRAGSLVILDDNGRNQFDEENSDYRGPLYFEFFNGRPDYGAIIPVQSTGIAIGMGTGVFLVFGAVVLAQGAARASSRDPEELDAVLNVAQVGRLPRMGRQRAWRLHKLRGLAVQIDGQCPRGVDRVALGGTDIVRERSGATMLIAGSLSMTLGRRVVIIDADSRRAGLSRRLRLHPNPGVIGLARGELALRDAAIQIAGEGRTRRMPLRYRYLFRGQDLDVAVIPMGALPKDRTEIDDLPFDPLIADVIEQLAQNSLVVVALPPLPASHSVQRIMASVDAALLVLLDGWSGLDDAEENAAALSSMAPGRVGFVLIDN